MSSLCSLLKSKSVDKSKQREDERGRRVACGEWRGMAGGVAYRRSSVMLVVMGWLLPQWLGLQDISSGGA